MMSATTGGSQAKEINFVDHDCEDVKKVARNGNQYGLRTCGGQSCTPVFLL